MLGTILGSLAGALGSGLMGGLFGGDSKDPTMPKQKTQLPNDPLVVPQAQGSQFAPPAPPTQQTPMKFGKQAPHIQAAISKYLGG